MKAVIVYSRVGGGHLSAARALALELEASGRCTTRLVDVYIENGRFPVTRFPDAYARLARRHPRLWSLIYNGTQRSPIDPRRVVAPLLRGGIRRLIDAERPDVIVSVLPAVNGLLAKAAARVSARTEVVLTDWHRVHPFWVAPGVDHYTSPTESAREDCIRYGALPETVDVIGIPVRREFAVRVSADERDRLRTERLTALGLPPGAFTILVMVGAEGSPRAIRNLANLLKADIAAQVVVICGRNEALRRRIMRLPARLPVRALGYTDDVADWMRACDVLVTKPGGLTLAEAFCCEVPVVIHDVLPGQEAGNLEYVLQRGAVAYGPLVQTIAELATDAGRREALAQRGAELAPPDAARQITNGILARRLDAASAKFRGDPEA